MEWCSYKGFSHNSNNFILQTPDSADLSKVAQGFLQGLCEIRMEIKKEKKMIEHF